MYAASVATASNRDRRVIAAALVLLGLHGALLLAALGDWRVTIDSAYHVALARSYGERGLVAWDHINFGPGGRPNLQAPLMYLVVGGLGRVLGGTGGDYVLANAMVAAAQWAAAMATAAAFALWIGGEWAMLFAATLLSGAAFAATSFAVGIPSGWLFILTPWAIHFFLRRRLGPAALLTAAAIYVHIGGIVTAPLGVAVAAALERRWRALIAVGAGVALLTAPYTIHCLYYLQWLRDVRSHSALLFDPMLDALGVAGLVAALKRPRDNAFLVAWAAAPIAWLFQDPGRFILQSGLAASVLAGVWVARRIAATASNHRALYGAALAAIATLWPLGVPALGAEAAWAGGIRYPRAVDWNNAHVLASTIESNGLGNDLVADYMPALCPAIAVYAPLRCEKGHWVEVQPKIDFADALSAAGKVYVLPLDPHDRALDAMGRRGWLRAWGGSGDSSVVTLAARAPLDAAAAVAGAIVTRQAEWLSTHVVNNSFDASGWRTMLSQTALERWRMRMARQRERAGRIELALVVYAYALEPTEPSLAARMRRAARGFGVIASFLGDDLALDFESPAATARLRRSLGALADAARPLAVSARPLTESTASGAARDCDGAAFARALDETLDCYLVTEGVSFAERPPNNNLPWLSALGYRG